MSVQCPYCDNHSQQSQPTLRATSPIVRHGSYRRRSDGVRIFRLRCLRCMHTFSASRNDVCFNQKKRHLNHPIWMLLVSGVSLRRLSLLLKISRTTAARKLIFLGKLAQEDLNLSLCKISKIDSLEFDDMETFEHSKLKPLSISLAVESKTRRVLGFEVSQMPANGTLARRARQRYGKRIDHRSIGRATLLKRIALITNQSTIVKSDQNPQYPPLIKKILPSVQHLTFKGRRGCVVGQGELKRGGFDPLFSLNHTAAMFRANVNRLFRRTWCTTKKRDALTAHLAIYATFHNQNIH